MLLHSAWPMLPLCWPVKPPDIEFVLLQMLIFALQQIVRNKTAVLVGAEDTMTVRIAQVRQG